MVIIMVFWSWAFWSSWSTLSFLSLHGHCDHYAHHDHSDQQDHQIHFFMTVVLVMAMTIKCAGSQGRSVMCSTPNPAAFVTRPLSLVSCVIYYIKYIYYIYNILQCLRQILLLTVKMWKMYPALTMSYFQWPPSTDIQFQFNPLVKWWPCIENIENIQFQFNPPVNWWLFGAALPLTPKPSQLPCSRPWLAITGM